MENLQTSTRDGVLPSLWQEHRIKIDQSGELRRFSADQLWDVLIVGGGITGLTSALKLQEAGKRCLLIEAKTLGYGTTGGTTTHLNTMLDTPYHQIESDFGEQGAKFVAEASKSAIALVARNVEKYQIDCDFQYKDGYLFAENDQQAATLDKIFQASLRAEVDVIDAPHIPVPLSFKKALNFRRQAQFHPLKYLDGMAKAFQNAGGVILEQVKSLSSEKEGDIHYMETTQGQIKAKTILYATHIPPGINIIHLRCAPYRSYVLAARLASDDQYPQDLAYDMQDPYHYFRTHEIEGRKYLLLGGADHKTGHGNPEDSFRSLESYLRAHYNVQSIDYKWSSQFYESADGLPYIGEMPGSNDQTYIATGFNGNGILFGTYSALLLHDLILGIDNPHAELFTPKRIKLVAAFKNFVKENADVAYRFVADRLRTEDLESMIQLVPGTGAVVNYENEKMAVYKSEAGKVVALSPVCTHAGCIVAWNDAEKSWDCPCHGGRYDPEGAVITGPPRKNLQEISLIK